jgi:hypothetical protein
VSLSRVLHEERDAGKIREVLSSHTSKGRAGSEACTVIGQDNNEGTSVEPDPLELVDELAQQRVRVLKLHKMLLESLLD